MIVIVEDSIFVIEYVEYRQYIIATVQVCT
jgi:hypothetical protein